MVHPVLSGVGALAGVGVLLSVLEAVLEGILSGILSAVLSCILSAVQYVNINWSTISVRMTIELLDHFV